MTSRPPRSYLLRHRFLAGPLALALLVLASAFAAKPKVLKGTLYPSATLLDAEKGKICRVDSGMGDVVQISQAHDNPLFPSKSPNKVHLLLHFEQGIQHGRTYTLPDSTVSVCYYEKGDLLMFHTFQGTGTIRFDASAKPTVCTGKMELKLVKPHHNMSNSDYHYLGGKFSLAHKALP